MTDGETYSVMEEALRVCCSYCGQPPNLQCVTRRGPPGKQHLTIPHRRRRLRAKLFAEHQGGEHVKPDWDCEQCYPAGEAFFRPEKIKTQLSKNPNRALPDDCCVD